MFFVINGQPKSASTFLARIVRYVCEAAGTDQTAIRKKLLTGVLESKRTFWDGSLAPIPSVADRRAPGAHKAADIVPILRDQIGVSQGDLDANTNLQDLLAGRQRTYNFNKGTSGRHKEVFSKEDLDHLYAQCGHFISFSDGDISLKDL